GNDPDACLELGLYKGDCLDGPCTTLTIDPDAQTVGGVPISRFFSAATDAAGALTAGPGFVVIELPILDGAVMKLPVSAKLLEGTLTTTLSGKIGGVLQAEDLDRERTFVLDDVGQHAGDSLLDFFYANLLGPLLALDQDADGCRSPDIDVDGDGLEKFCDSNPDDDIKTVDTCIDGNGTVRHDGDGGRTHCTDWP